MDVMTHLSHSQLGFWTPMTEPVPRNDGDGKCWDGRMGFEIEVSDGISLKMCMGCPMCRAELECDIPLLSEKRYINIVRILFAWRARRQAGRQAGKQTTRQFLPISIWLENTQISHTCFSRFESLTKVHETFPTRINILVRRQSFSCSRFSICHAFYVSLCWLGWWWAKSTRILLVNLKNRFSISCFLPAHC